MNQPASTRAAQHLLLQGFTVYPCAAAVCTRLVASGLLDDPRHAWAVVFDSASQSWLAHLPDGDPLAPAFGEAAIRSAAGAQHAVCHTMGSLLVAPLDPADPVLRTARVRIEGAITLGKAPPAERLEAFPDELIEREARRRRLIAREPAEETGAEKPE